jgi:hypothetical protein
MNKIPFQRLLIYIFICSLIPAIFAGLNFLYHKKKLNVQEAYVNGIYQTILLENERQTINEIIYAHYQKANPQYIEEHLETLSFLNGEKEKISQLQQLEVFRDHESLQKRLDFLSGKQNQLVFVEGAIETYPCYKETILSLAHPVEVDVEDLKKILSRIENLKIDSYEPMAGCPHFIITEFKLERKSHEGQDEVFKLDMKLLKRDY